MGATLRVLAATLGVASLTAATAATPPPLVGVWKGQIGDVPVMACFTEQEAEYYYLKRLRGITLVRPAKDAAQGRVLPVSGYELEEKTGPGYGDMPVTGRWRLQGLDAAQLSGTWTAPKGDRVLPIRLTRVERDPAEQVSDAYSCGAAFMAPVLAGMQVRTAEVVRFNGHAFKRIVTEDATALQVGNDVPHADELNRFAMDWLREQAALRYDCDKGKASASNGAAALGRTLTPIFWSKHLLVLEDLLPELYCGGAHGSYSLTYVTWSLARGEKVDGWRWIQGGEGRLKDAKAPDHKSPLLKLLERKHPRNVADDSCAEDIPHMSVGAPYPSADGLVFDTKFSHAMRACNDAVKLTWKQLRPFLSKQGRELAASPR